MRSRKLRQLVIGLRRLYRLLISQQQIEAELPFSQEEFARLITSRNAGDMKLLARGLADRRVKIN